ncbi:hypothetical protein [Parvularcula sp. IMCC14364]|uniref:hypothetical protein n=1 Tax=Parvularcula sp. IMCC14364 TaxID=3067902 RepID=UPI0027419451|nr:hypothetical protein [Parvularcula sp. IMCC14364]
MAIRLFFATLIVMLAAGCITVNRKPMNATPDWEDTQICKPETNVPDAPWADGKVQQIPIIRSGADPRRCSVKPMTIAVRYQGAFRQIYGEEGSTVPDRSTIDPSLAIDPVIFHLRAQAEKWAAENAPRDGAPQEPFKLLVFGHGGMVSHEGALRNAEALAPMMLRDGYQPLFLIWNSDFKLTYADSLCCVRKGSRDTIGDSYFITSRLIRDIGGGIFRSPEVFGDQQIRWNQSVIQRKGTEYYLTADRLQRACDELAYNGNSRPDLNRCMKQRISLPFMTPETDLVFDTPEEERQFDLIINDQVYRVGQKELQYSALFPVRFLTSMIGPDVGTRAWDNMVRRTRLAFEVDVRDPAYDAYIEEQSYAGFVQAFSPVSGAGCGELTRQASMRLDRQKSESGGRLRDKDRVTGGFALFFDRLNCELQLGNGGFLIDGERIPVEVHYYGHSMGALVGNELLWRYAELPWKKVVYMGGASTIRDFRTLAAPTIREKEIEFHNLSLHPIAESRELYLGGVPPQGSLLEWIDELFEDPRSADQRTLGKWTNIEKMLPALDEELKAHMHFRVFPKQANMLEARSDLERAAYDRECSPEPGFGNPAGMPIRCHPTKHGEFNIFSFWRDAYLTGFPAQ